MIQPVLVICFGDSLTAGFQSPTGANPAGKATPYGDNLQDQLGTAARVLVSGICGELTGDMIRRFRRDVLDHRPGFVPILGGTNDLGWNAAPADIMRNLVTLYEQTLAIGGVPIPVTVPSIRVLDGSGSLEASDWVAGHLARRRELNALIRGYAASKKLASVDLSAATADPDSGQLAAVYSNDGIHLTTAGYRLFAGQVAQVLKPIMVSGGNS
jgi:lysophospholipase L1-like esterase